MVIPCVLFHLLAELRRRSKRAKGGKVRIGEHQCFVTQRDSRTRALTVAKRITFAARRVQPSDRWSQRDVPTRWRGRNYGCCVAVPPERHDEPMSLIRGRAELVVGDDCQDRGSFSPNSQIEGTSAMMRRSDSGAEKMMGTSIDSPKLVSLEPGATAILQQNWRGGREVENRRGEIGKTRETYFYAVLLLFR